MIETKFIALLIVLSTGFVAPAQTAWTLDSCIRYAQQNNLTVLQADIQKQASFLTLVQGEAGRWPTLSLNANTGYRFGLSENPTTGTLQSNNYFSSGAGASTSVTLFNWFNTRHTLKSLRLAVSAEDASVQKTKDETAISVCAAFLQAALATELIDAAELRLAQSKAQLAMVEKKVLLGVAPPPDAAQVRIQLLNDSAALFSAQESRQNALWQLQLLLALHPSPAFDIELPSTNEDTSSDMMGIQPRELIAASSRLPQLRQIAYQVAATKEQVKAAKASRLPVLSFYGSIGSNFVNIPSAQGIIPGPPQPTGAKVMVNGISYDVTAPSYQNVGFGVMPFFRQFQQNFGQNIGLGLSIPVLNGNAIRTNIKRLELTGRQLDLQTVAQKQTIETAIYTAYTEAVTAVQRHRLYKRVEEEAAGLLVASEKRYNLNLLSAQDLLINTAKLQQARIDVLTSAYNLLFKKKVLEYYRNGRFE